MVIFFFLTIPVMAAVRWLQCWGLWPDWLMTWLSWLRVSRLMPLKESRSRQVVIWLNSARAYPGANLWYAKAALDHMIFNQLQEYFSHGYLRKMEQRSKKEFNQTYWWRPQDVTPE